MPQDRESGNRARQWGLDMGSHVAEWLGAQLLKPGRSNEAALNGQQIAIKSAHLGDDQIGVTEAMLARVQSVVAVLQDSDGLYSIYSVNTPWYREHVRQRNPQRKDHTRMVRTDHIRQEGHLIGRTSGLD